MEIIQKYLTPNEWSRPQIPMHKIRGIVIHWTGSPMGNWNGVWNFFEDRKNGRDSYGSAQFIVGLDGTVIQTMPLDEMAYAVGSSTYPQEAINRLGSYPNNSTLSIEMCVVDDYGNMNFATIQNTKELCVHLLQTYGLTENDLWLHKEVVGWKECHKLFCDYPDMWVQFKQEIGAMLRGESQQATEQPNQEECKVDQLQQWQIDMGCKALEELGQMGLVSNVPDWQQKLGEHVPNWLFFELMKRIAEKK
jgi:N-acetylmuramoyl-L-alanine amidase